MHSKVVKIIEELYDPVNDKVKTFVIYENGTWENFKVRKYVISRTGDARRGHIHMYDKVEYDEDIPMWVVKFQCRSICGNHYTNPGPHHEFRKTYIVPSYDGLCKKCRSRKRRLWDGDFELDEILGI